MHFRKIINQINVIKILLIFISISLLFAFIFDIIINKIRVNPKLNYDDPLKSNLILKFILNVFFVPLLETLILTLIPYVIISFKVKNILFKLFALSVFFSLAHFYSLSYMIFGFVSGLLINGFFIIIEKKQNLNSAFIFTVIYHSLYNLIVFFVNNITLP